MDQDGILYLSRTLSQLFGMPVRVYKEERLLGFFSTSFFVKDPFSLYENRLREEEKNVRYFSTDDFFYYGILRSGTYQIVAGPFCYFHNSRQAYYSLAFRLGIEKKEQDSFIDAMSSVSPMPLETVIQSLCSYNYVLNGEKTSIEDLVIASEMQKEYEKEQLSKQLEGSSITETRNSTRDIEELLERFVEEGNIAGFDAWLKEAPAIRAGMMSRDYLRHQKDTFIISAAIFSRAAIRGGMEYNAAMDKSDGYIRQCESCTTYSEITNLSYAMVRDYILSVEKIRKEHSPLQTKIACYVYNHISEKITLDDLSRYLYLSKSSLCLHFRKEAGTTVWDYITGLRIEESKRLLRNTDRSLSSVALYLGFSSQAHFSKAFRDKEGISPAKYRKQQ